MNQWKSETTTYDRSTLRRECYINVIHTFTAAVNKSESVNISDDETNRRSSSRWWESVMVTTVNRSATTSSFSSIGFFYCLGCSPDHIRQLQWLRFLLWTWLAVWYLSSTRRTINAIHSYAAQARHTNWWIVSDWFMLHALHTSTPQHACQAVYGLGTCTEITVRHVRHCLSLVCFYRWKVSRKVLFKKGII